MHGCHGLNHIDTWAFHTLSIRRELYLVVVPHLALVLLSLPLFLLEDQRWQLEEVDLRTDRLGIVCCTFFECNGGCALSSARGQLRWRHHVKLRRCLQAQIDWILQLVAAIVSAKSSSKAFAIKLTF